MSRLSRCLSFQSNSPLILAASHGAAFLFIRIHALFSSVISVIFVYYIPASFLRLFLRQFQLICLSFRLTLINRIAANETDIQRLILLFCSCVCALRKSDGFFTMSFPSLVQLIPPADRMHHISRYRRSGKCYQNRPWLLIPLSSALFLSSAASEQLWCQNLIPRQINGLHFNSVPKRKQDTIFTYGFAINHISVLGSGLASGNGIVISGQNAQGDTVRLFFIVPFIHVSSVFRRSPRSPRL